MSASEVTDFERSFRYFAIWLHGQVFSKLLLGLFFQCQKSDWTYLKKNSRQWALIRVRTKRSSRHVWTGACSCVCACPRRALVFQLTFRWESKAFQLDFIPDPTWWVACLVGYLFFNFFSNYRSPQIIAWPPWWTELGSTDLDFGGICETVGRH